MKRLFYISILIFIQIARAQSLSVSGEWNLTIPTSDITEAGEDFSGSYSSSSNQVYLNIWTSGRWSVYVQKNDIDWDDNIQLYLRRTGDGYGYGYGHGHSSYINGGSNYTEIKDRDYRFFQGRYNRYYIPIQFEIRNVSVTIPANTYITEIVYTLQAN